ncbi:MAG: hypothetical protein ABIZ04_11900 [Opitutus sp.]
MKLIKLLGVALVLLAGLSAAQAAELAGHWTAEFDTQIGVQKYAYDFKGSGADLTGKATYEHSMGKGEVVLSAIKVAGDDVSFTEALKFDGNEITITYSGKIAGDELKLTRKVGDFATEEIVAKRAQAAASKPADTK